MTGKTSTNITCAQGEILTSKKAYKTVICFFKIINNKTQYYIKRCHSAWVRDTFLLYFGPNLILILFSAHRYDFRFLFCVEHICVCIKFNLTFILAYSFYFSKHISKRFFVFLCVSFINIYFHSFVFNLYSCKYVFALTYCTSCNHIFCLQSVQDTQPYFLTK